jgi:hypothetical protein
MLYVLSMLYLCLMYVYVLSMLQAYTVSRSCEYRLSSYSLRGRAMFIYTWPIRSTLDKCRRASLYLARIWPALPETRHAVWHRPTLKSIMPYLMQSIQTTHTEDPWVYVMLLRTYRDRTWTPITGPLLSTVSKSFGSRRSSTWPRGCTPSWQVYTNKTQVMPFIPTKSVASMSTSWLLGNVYTAKSCKDKKRDHDALKLGIVG